MGDGSSAWCFYKTPSKNKYEVYESDKGRVPVLKIDERCRVGSKDGMQWIKQERYKNKTEPLQQTLHYALRQSMKTIEMNLNLKRCVGSLDRRAQRVWIIIPSSRLN